MKNEAQLLWGLLYSSVGIGYFIYGRKKGGLVPMVCGLALMIYPYFVPNTYVLVAIGAMLTALPYCLRR